MNAMMIDFFVEKSATIKQVAMEDESTMKKVATAIKSPTMMVVKKKEKFFENLQEHLTSMVVTMETKIEMFGYLKTKMVI